MKNRIFYFILFSIFLISCTDLKFIGKPAYVLPEYDTVIYGPIENGKVNANHQHFPLHEYKVKHPGQNQKCRVEEGDKDNLHKLFPP